MADAVLSVRLDDKAKDKFLGLAQAEGINNRELLQMMMKHYELDLAKDGALNFSREVEEMQRLTKRVGELYLGMIERVQLQDLEVKNSQAAALEHSSRENDKLVQKIAALSQEIKQGEEKLTASEERNEALQRNLEELLVLKELNSLLVQKNKELEQAQSADRQKLERGEAAAAENLGLKEELAELKQTLSKSAFKIETMEEDRLRQHQQWEKAQLDLSLKAAVEIELIKKQHQVELREARLQAREGFEERLTALQDGFEEKIRTQQAFYENQLRERIQEQPVPSIDPL